MIWQSLVCSVSIATNGIKLTEGGFYRQLVCSRFWLGCVSGALAFTVKLLKKKKKRWRA